MADGTCQGTRRDGSACQARALPGRAWCWAHDPEAAAKRQQAYAAGGRNKRSERRAERLLPEVMKPILHHLIAGMVAVERGSMEPRVGTALAAMATAVVRVYEMSSLEQRLLALEERSGRVHHIG